MSHQKNNEFLAHGKFSRVTEIGKQEMNMKQTDRQTFTRGTHDFNRQKRQCKWNRMCEALLRQMRMKLKINISLNRVTARVVTSQCQTFVSSTQRHCVGTTLVSFWYCLLNQISFLTSWLFVRCEYAMLKVPSRKSCKGHVMRTWNEETLLKVKCLFFLFCN
jgi:hypothetical protein